jgi:hypothetical protein
LSVGKPSLPWPSIVKFSTLSFQNGNTIVSCCVPFAHPVLHLIHIKTKNVSTFFATKSILKLPAKEWQDKPGHS